ncbi:MAG TPA: hypothetical protein VGB91_10320 [Rhizomicrobium sp.]
MRADRRFNGLLTGLLIQEDPGATPENGVWVNATYGSSSGTVSTLDDETIMVSLSYSPTEDYKVFADTAPK